MFWGFCILLLYFILFCRADKICFHLVAKKQLFKFLKQNPLTSVYFIILMMMTIFTTTNTTCQRQDVQQFFVGARELILITMWFAFTSHKTQIDGQRNAKTSQVKDIFYVLIAKKQRLMKPSLA